VESESGQLISEFLLMNVRVHVWLGHNGKIVETVFHLYKNTTIKCSVFSSSKIEGFCAFVLNSYIV